MKRRIVVTAIVSAVFVLVFASQALAESSYSAHSIPYGTITSNVSKGALTAYNGGGYWIYTVSAIYEGSYSVERVRTTWTGSVYLRKSAKLELRMGYLGNAASASSSWQAISQTKYWENTNGNPSAFWTNGKMFVTPTADCMTSSVALSNKATLKIRGDARIWETSAAVRSPFSP